MQHTHTNHRGCKNSNVYTGLRQGKLVSAMGSVSRGPGSKRTGDHPPSSTLWGCDTTLPQARWSSLALPPRTLRSLINLTECTERLWETIAMQGARTRWELDKCYLEYTGPIRCSPGIQKVVLSSAYKPFAYRNSLEKGLVCVTVSDTRDLLYGAQTVHRKLF